MSHDLPLGKPTTYEDKHNPTLLFPVSRVPKRKEIGVDPDHLPFQGFDCWNHYEVSWLNEKGKPLVATAEIIYDCTSPNIVESKSLKLYFNSLNNMPFSSISAVSNTIQTDLEGVIKTPVQVALCPLNADVQPKRQGNFEGFCLDTLDITCNEYLVNPNFLTTDNQAVEEVVYSNLLKSNCLITHQPDWGSVQIAYSGRQINHEGLLRYIVSFRNHNEFHEQCIERIFIDIMQRCQPDTLTVYGRYTRRGGIDINPYRSTAHCNPRESNILLYRQ